MKRFMQAVWEGNFAGHYSDAIFLLLSFLVFMLKNGQRVFVALWLSEGCTHFNIICTTKQVFF